MIYFLILLGAGIFGCGACCGPRVGVSGQEESDSLFHHATRSQEWRPGSQVRGGAPSPAEPCRHRVSIYLLGTSLHLIKVCIQRRLNRLV